jgi:hypothetical protein
MGLEEVGCELASGGPVVVSWHYRAVLRTSLICAVLLPMCSCCCWDAGSSFVKQAPLAREQSCRYKLQVLCMVSWF